MYTDPNPTVTWPQLLVEPAHVYHEKAGKPYLSSHLLGTFRRCPQEYIQRISGLIPDKDSNAYQVGRAWHCWTFEGVAAFREQFTADSPINPKTGNPFGSETKAYAEWAATVRAAGREPITPDQSMLAGAMARSVHEHEEAHALLRDGFAERVVRAALHDEPCQIRCDWLTADLSTLVDGKTCDDLTYFVHDARRFGYIHQLAFYQAVLDAAGAPIRQVYLIATEKRQPYRTGVWLVPEALLELARRENEQAIDRLQACRSSGVYPTLYEGIRTFDSL